MSKEWYQQQQEWGSKGEFAGRAHGGNGGPSQNWNQGYRNSAIKAMATVDKTTNVTVVMEDMTILFATSTVDKVIIATSRVITGKYPDEVVTKVATNHTKSLHLVLISKKVMKQYFPM